MRLKLTLEYDGTAFPRLGGAAGPAHDRGSRARRARGVFPSFEQPRGRGADRRRCARARQCRQRRRRRRPAARARRRSAQRGVAGRRRGRRRRGGRRRTSTRGTRRASRSYRYRIWRRREPSPFEQRRSLVVSTAARRGAAGAMRPTCSSARTTSARSRRPRRSTRFRRTVTARRGTGAATRSCSRSPPTAFSGTWCGRSSGRCSSCRRSGSRRCSKGAPAPRRGRPRRRGGSTSNESRLA